jgi:hypothetical protein
MLTLVSWIGRGLGIVASAICCVLWVAIIWFPSSGLEITGLSVIVAGMMALLALIAAIASFKGHAIVIFVVFVASFLPVGAYVLGAAHWVRFVGMLNVAMLAASLLIAVGNRGKRNEQ